MTWVYICFTPDVLSLRVSWTTLHRDVLLAGHLLHTLLYNCLFVVFIHNGAFPQAGTTSGAVLLFEPDYGFANVVQGAEICE